MKRFNNKDKKRLWIRLSALSVTVWMLFGGANAANAGFDGSFDNGGSGWGYSTYSTLTSEESYSGGSAAKISNTSGINAMSYISAKVTDITPGASYDFSAMLHLSGMALADTAARVQLRVRFYYNTNATGENLILTSVPVSHTEGWQSVTERFAAPAGAKSAILYVVYTGSKGMVYIDDVTFHKVTEVKVVRLETDNVFYYSDLETGKAMLLPTEFFGSFSGTGQIRLKKGDDILFKTFTMKIGKAGITLSFPLAELDEAIRTETGFLPVPYTVEAFVWDEAGKLYQEERQTVYKYPRPPRIGKDGIYRQDGVQFDPVIMNTCWNRENYVYLPEAGVNMVAAYVDPASVKAAKDAKIKLLGVLYVGMRPAGHSDNAAYVEQILTTWKDEETVFGWILMDEPTYHFHDPWQSLEESYKLVREFDPARPIYVMADSNYKEIGKYTDILAIDPYIYDTNDPDTYVSECTKAAVSAVDGTGKPVYTVLQTSTQSGYFPTEEAVHSMIYQALFEGAKGIGYYGYDGVKTVPDPVNSAKTKTLSLKETELWKTLCRFGKAEKEIAFSKIGRNGDRAVVFKAETETYAILYTERGAPISVYAASYQSRQGKKELLSLQSVTIPAQNSNVHFIKGIEPEGTGNLEKWFFWRDILSPAE